MPVTQFLFGMPSFGELLVILVIVLLIFGNRLPSVMRNLGKSVNSFKKGLNEGKEEDDTPEPRP